MTEVENMLMEVLQAGGSVSTERMPGVDEKLLHIQTGELHTRARIVPENLYGLPQALRQGLKHHTQILNKE